MSQNSNQSTVISKSNKVRINNKYFKYLLFTLFSVLLTIGTFYSFNHFHYNNFIEVNSKELKPVFNSSGTDNSNNNTIAIAFASDNKYAKYTAVALQSILDNKSPQYNYDIVILENSISRRNKTLMTRMCEKHKNISLRFVDMEKVYDEYNRDEFFVSYMAISIYNRLFIPDMFSDYDRVIYLDSDVLIKSDLTSLLKIDMTNYALAGVDDMANNTWHPEKAYGFGGASEYINSGFILFNIEECKKTQFLQSCLSTLRRLKNPVKHDQTVINTAYENRIKRLDWRYNFFANWLDNKPDVYKYIPKDSIDNIEILHFAGYSPWKDVMSNSVIEWHNYTKETPYYGSIVRKYKERIWRYTLLGKINLNKNRRIRFREKAECLRKKVKDLGL